MKILLLLFSAISNNLLQFDCGLAIELEPLQYIFVKRSQEIKITLNSNCMSLRDF